VGIAVLLAAAAIAASPASYVQSRQQADGGFAEAGGVPGPELTAWATLGLRAGGAETGNALSYLVAHERELSSPTSMAYDRTNARLKMPPGRREMSLLTTPKTITRRK